MAVLAISDSENFLNFIILNALSCHRGHDHFCRILLQLVH